MITVILADDHAILRDGLRFLLEAAGDIQIISMAANGQEAVEQAEMHCPDVIVMDISMPVMSGIEATKHVLVEAGETLQPPESAARLFVDKKPRRGIRSDKGKKRK